MKKTFVWMLVCALLFADIALAGGFELPEGLTEIGSDAFNGDSAVSGVVTVPDYVSSVGENAFSGTSVYALVLPESTLAIGAQRLEKAAYVLFEGAQTVPAQLSGVGCLIAPQNSAANAFAQENGMGFAALETLVESNGFYYTPNAQGLTLLCAKDADAVGTEVSIPAQIAGAAVTQTSSFAFRGCTSLEQISLPEALSPAEGALADCPGAQLVYPVEGVVVRSVTANVSGGTVGECITWSTEAVSEQEITGYLYTLSLNGETIAREESSVCVFTYETAQAGEYVLTVQAFNADGESGSAVSSALYIAVESMNMTVPQTLVNGEDLVIAVGEVAGAVQYSVVVTNEETGESLGMRTLTKPGSVTYYGYLLEEGVYRVSGYVYGNDFRYSVPTVQTVTVSGEKAQGPELPEFDPIEFDYGSVNIALQGYDRFAVRYCYRNSSGDVSGISTSVSGGEELWINAPYSDYENWIDGGAVVLRCAACTDGVWSAWGPEREIQVLPAQMLDAPVLTMPETSEAGKDVVVQIGAVENAQSYSVCLFEGYDEDYAGGKSGNPLYYVGLSDGASIVLPGYLLDAGEYALMADVWAEGYMRPKLPAYQKLTVNGERPAAPAVTQDKTERYLEGDSITISISAPGAEGAVIIRSMENWGSWGEETVSLDENGLGTFRDTWNYGEEIDGETMCYDIAVITDGKWSSFARCEVLMHKSEPLEQSVISAPAELTAGEDLSFSFAPVENAQSYSVSVSRAYGSESLESWSGSEAVSDTPLTMKGYDLTQGSYYITVRAASEDFEESVSQTIVAVSGSRDAAPAVTASTEELHIKETVSFTVDTAGAEELRVEYTSSGGQGNWTYNYGFDVVPSADTYLWNYTVGSDDLDMVYTFRFSAKKDGRWSAWSVIERTILDLPPLDAPVVSAKETCAAGEDVYITFAAVENAQSYTCRLFKDDTQLDYESMSAPRTMYYRGCDLEPGSYLFAVSAESGLYVSSYTEICFTVEGTKSEAPAVSVDMTEAELRQRYTFTVDTTGAEALRYRLEYVGNYTTGGDINVFEDTTKWSGYGTSAGVREYSFSAYVSGFWTEWSDPIAITVVESEVLDKAAAELPSSVELGQDLTVTVQQVSGATGYTVYLYNAQGAQVLSREISDSAGGTVTFDGYRLAAGVYTVQVRAYNANASSSVDHSVTVVSAERPEAPAVQVDTDTARVNVKYSFTVDTTGAQRYAVRYYREDDTNNVSYYTYDASGDSSLWQDSKGTAGYTWNYAFAVCVEGRWSGWSAIEKVSITNREQLAQAVLNIPERVEAGSDVTVTFDAVENADSYTLYLNWPDGRRSSWTAYPGTGRTISGYDLEPGVYSVEVKASGAEYDSSTSEQSFTAVGEREAAPAVSVDLTEVYTSDLYTFVIDSREGEEIVYRITNSDSSSSSVGRLNVLSDSTVWETSCSWDTVRFYSFTLCREGRWSQWSEPIGITVKERPALDAPVISVPASLSLGSDLSVNVEAVEGASQYSVYVYDNKGNSVDSRNLYDAGTASIPGYRLSVGALRVEVVAYGSNNGRSTAEASCTVLEAELPAAPAVTPPESLTVAPQTYFSFVLDTQDASKCVVRYYRIGSPNSLWISEFNASADASTTWRDYLYNSGETYAYSFAVQRDGVWSEWSSFIEITVE